MIVLDRDAPEILELPFRAELGPEQTTVITRKCLHSAIVAIDNEQETSMMVEHQACGIVELAIGITIFLGADRELDSSISIKSVVFHLFHFNLSHTTTKICSKSQLLKPKR